MKRTIDIRDQKRPNCFIAIKIKSPIVIENIQKIQNEFENVLNVNPKLFHVTLNVLYINNFEKLKMELKNLNLKNFKLKLKNLAGFQSSNVVYVDFDDESKLKLKEIHENIKSKFNSNSQFVEFNPHLTIARGYIKKFGTMIKEPIDFGQQEVDSIYCYLMGSRVNDEYVKIFSLKLKNDT